jgi:hypothetical protein
VSAGGGGESGVPTMTVSIDLLVKALLKTRVSVQEIGRSLEKVTSPRMKRSRVQRLAHA